MHLNSSYQFLVLGNAGALWHGCWLVNEGSILRKLLRVVDVTANGWLGDGAPFATHGLLFVAVEMVRVWNGCIMIKADVKNLPAAHEAVVFLRINEIIHCSVKTCFVSLHSIF